MSTTNNINALAKTLFPWMDPSISIRELTRRLHPVKDALQPMYRSPLTWSMDVVRNDEKILRYHMRQGERYVLVVVKHVGPARREVVGGAVVTYRGFKRQPWTKRRPVPETDPNFNNIMNNYQNNLRFKYNNAWALFGNRSKHFDNSHYSYGERNRIHEWQDALFVFETLGAPKNPKKEIKVHLMRPIYMKDAAYSVTVVGLESDGYTLGREMSYNIPDGWEDEDEDEGLNFEAQSRARRAAAKKRIDQGKSVLNRIRRARIDKLRKELVTAGLGLAIAKAAFSPHTELGRRRLKREFEKLTPTNTVNVTRQAKRKK